MNPISRVNRKARIDRTTGTMAQHPDLAVMVADCIAAYSEIELNLAKALACILNADIRTAMAMYAGVENRAAQWRMIRAAIDASGIPENQKDLFNAVLSGCAKPCRDDRDKLAHWCWGFSPDIEDALLLFEPTSELRDEVEIIDKAHLARVDPHNGYVLRRADLERMLERFRWTDHYVRHLQMVLRPFAGIEDLSDRSFDLLSKVPQIAEALRRLREPKKNNQEAHQQSPTAESSE